MNVLLVTGSRSLTNNEYAYDAWLDLFRPLAVRAALVVAGDAIGPDRWALDRSANTGNDFEEWSLDGSVYSSRSSPVCWWSASKPRPPSRRWPLARNTAMVRHVAGLRGAIETLAPDNWTGPGYETRLLCVGFVDPNSRTRGTDHTLRLARQAGIWCARYVWQGAGFEEQS